MRALLALAAFATLAAACGSDVGPPEPDRETISRSRFAAVLEELSLARSETMPDTAAWHARRSAVLDRHGVEAEDLARFVEEHGRDDDVMGPVYRKVGARLDSLFQERPASDRFPTALPEDEPVRYGPRGLEPVPGDTTTPGDTTAPPPP